MTVNDLQLYRQAKKHLKGLEKLLKTFNIILLSLQEHKQYRPANECMLYLTAKKQELEAIIEELVKIKETKGER